MPPNVARIEGPNLNLRLIQPEDAEYVYALRSDTKYNKYLSPISGTTEDQQKWIMSYKIREHVMSELYYVIERGDGDRCGLVRIYQISTNSFTWGSWILDVNKPPKAALESAFLVYELAFNRLGKSQSTFEVVHENNPAIDFHRRFGAVETGRNEHFVEFVYHRERYEADRASYEAILRADTGNSLSTKV